MRFYLIRHARTQTTADTCYGSSDVPVSIAEDNRVLRQLSVLLPKNMPVYASPLSRCANLAKRLAVQQESQQPVIDSRLTELHFGTWEMQAWEHIEKSEVDAWSNNLVAYRPGGGESVLEAAHRVKSFYDDMLESPYPEIVVVCHAGTIRLLLACKDENSIAEIAHAAASRPHRIAYGELIRLDSEKSRI